VSLVVANLPSVPLTPVENLPPVSATLGVPVAKFCNRVVDTGDKYATGVVTLAASLLPLSLTQVPNLPPVALIPMVHLDLQISPQIFEKKVYDPNDFHTS
jgi:hypothetical protein